MKPKKCKACGQLFQPARAMQKACSPACAIELNKAVRERAYKTAQAKARREDRQKRERLKTRSEWMKEAQVALNKVARLRDILAGRGCISCGAPYRGAYGGVFDAGHYRSRGSAPHLRYDLRNIHMQCRQCNDFLGGNAIEYRRGLVQRKGLAFVEALEADQAPRHHNIEYLQRLKRVMQKKARRLEKRLP